MPTPELLSPAGTFKSMQYAFAYGADAVYAGQPRYSLRVRNNDFSQLERIAEAVAYAHDIGKQFFIASNVSPHNDKLRSYLRDMEPVIEMRPDALIMADPGLIMMVRERWPDMPVHLSVQANAVNWATVKFWKTDGAHAHHPVARTVARGSRGNPPGMPRHRARGLRARSVVHRLLGSLPALGLHHPPRFEPGRLHQHLSLEIPGTRSRGNRFRRCGRRLPATTRARARRARQPDLPAAGRGPSRRVHAGLRRRTRHLHHELQGPARHPACAAADRYRRRLPENRGAHQVTLLRGAHRASLSPRHRRRTRGQGLRHGADERTREARQPWLYRGFLPAPSAR